MRLVLDREAMRSSPRGYLFDCILQAQLGERMPERYGEAPSAETILDAISWTLKRMKEVSQCS